MRESEEKTGMLFGEKKAGEGLLILMNEKIQKMAPP